MAENLMSLVVPDNDTERLQALYRYRILDAPPEESFNNIARIMADVFRVPIALISLVDRNRVVFKGNVGMPGVHQTDRKVSLCSFAILSPEPTVFSRPLEEPCLLSNPLVHGDFGLRFYAGAPLTTHDGFQIGSVCIVDKKERSFSKEQEEMLVRFARMVMHEIELRQSVVRQRETELQLQAANEEMRFVTDTVPQMVWATEADGQAYFFNRGWLDYTGLSLQQVLGEGWMQSLHPDDLEETRAAWLRAVATGCGYDVEYRVRRHDGVYRWFLVRGQPMKDETGRIVKWYGSNTDIHDQKVAEEALLISNERFDLVAKATQDAIWDWELTTGLIWWSEGFQTLFGYPKEEIEPTIDSWYNRVHPDDKEAVVSGIHQVIDGGGLNWWSEYRFRKRDGNYALVYDRGYVLRDGQGRAFRMLGSMQDITGRHQAEESLRRSHELQVFLLQLTDRLRHLVNPFDIQYEAACALGGRLGACRVGYAEDCGDGERVMVTRNYTYGVAGIEGVHRYDDYGVELIRRLRRGETVIQTDIAEDETLSAGEREAFLRLGAGASINLPLVKDGQLVALLFVHFARPHACTAEELMLLEETAERTWAAVERARAEQAVRISQERLEKAVSIETVGVIFFDLEGKIHDANAAFERMSGYSREELRRTDVRWDRLTPPEFMDVTLHSREEFLTKGKNTPYEKQYIRPDGSRWWGLFAGKRLSDSECVEFVVDITKSKQAEEELERKVLERTKDLEKLNAELRRTNANLEEFAYAASHDLKEPIRKIHFFADRLRSELSGKLDAHQTRLFERLELASKRMGNLIDDLLAYSQASRPLVLIEEVDLNELVQNVLVDLELEIQQKGATIHVDPLPLMEGHPRQLQQLFHNLIGNALKYASPETAPVIQIQYQSVRGGDIKPDLPVGKREGRYHYIAVRDNGIGFAQSDAERIFNVFTRLHGNAEYRGTGVGLSIVRKVVENHFGLIWAEGTPGAGAFFRILLPVRD